MAEELKFTYPDGYEEMLKKLEFIPEEQRHFLMKLFLSFAASGAF